MNPSITPAAAKPKARKRKPLNSSTRTRRSRYVVAALQAAYAVARNPKAHFSYRLEAARLICALENGLALQLKFSGHDLRRAIRDEIARGEVSEQLMKITGVVRKIEQDQRKIVAPMVEQASEQTTQQIAKVEASPQSASPETKAPTGSEDMKEILKKLSEKGRAASLPAQEPPAQQQKPAQVLADEVRFSDDEIAAIHNYAELRISVQELEAELSPFLTLEWGGEFKDRITAVKLTGVSFKPEDRITITPAILARAQTVAESPSPRNHQLVRDWVEMVCKAPFFTTGVEVLRELVWLKQQVSL